MTVPYHHLFICTGTTCEHEGAEEVLQSLKPALQKNGLERTTRVTLCRCLGQCGRGPNMVVYPEGTWYGKLDEANIQKVVTEHLVEGNPISALVLIPVDQD